MNDSRPLRVHRVIEIDTLTGAEKRLPNLTYSSWQGDLFTEAEARETVQWREQHVSSRYTYRIES